MTGEAGLFRRTPLERHALPDGREVWVQREDLCAGGAPLMPPLAKLRGVCARLERMAAAGVRHVGILDTRVSKSGQGVAALAALLGLRCTCYAPATQAEREDGSWLTPARRVARDGAGAELVALPASRTRMVLAAARRDLARRGGVMLPLGLPLYESVAAAAGVVRGMPAEVLAGTVVVPTGTGTILAGVLCGLLARADGLPLRVEGVSAAMSVRRQRPRVAVHVGRWVGATPEPTRAEEAWARLRPRVTLHRGAGDYYEPAAGPPPPFPAHPYYEGKAWDWLAARPDLPGPLLFYCVGS